MTVESLYIDKEQFYHELSRVIYHGLKKIVPQYFTVYIYFKNKRNIISKRFCLFICKTCIIFICNKVRSNNIFLGCKKLYNQMIV